MELEGEGEEVRGLGLMRGGKRGVFVNLERRVR